ncbi:MAG TPA: hypothetical protein VHJ76_00600 [Actinomycetota bacterium]|nr:hypothetical protein [Actinomycetota bacterium]
MKRAITVLRFAAVLATVWLTGGAEWPMSEVLGLLGSGGCC